MSDGEIVFIIIITIASIVGLNFITMPYFNKTVFTIIKLLLFPPKYSKILCREELRPYLQDLNIYVNNETNFVRKITISDNNPAKFEGGTFNHIVYNFDGRSEYYDKRFVPLLDKLLEIEKSRLNSIEKRINNILNEKLKPLVVSKGIKDIIEE